MAWGGDDSPVDSGAYSRSSDTLETVAAAGAVLVATTGFVLALHFVGLLAYSSFDDIVRMIDVNTTASTGSSKLLMQILAINCFAMLLVGIFGFVGIHMDSHAMVCTYFALTAVLMGFFFWVLGFGVTVASAVLPVLQRQGQEFCNASIHELYFVMLGCNQSAHPYLDAMVSSGSCGVTCEQRLRLLQSMGGCSFLHALCRAFVYTDLGRGECLVAASPGKDSSIMEVKPPPAGALVVSRGPPAARHQNHSESRKELRGVAQEHCCRHFCNMLTACTGYSYDPFRDRTCHLVSPMAPPRWLVRRDTGCDDYEFSDGQGHPLGAASSADFPGSLPIVSAGAAPGARECQRKELRTVLMRRMVHTSVWLTVGGLIAAVVLVGAMCTACLLQYSVTTRRQGRKGPLALLARMVLPCCRWRRKARVSRVQLEKGESDSEEASPLRPY